MGVTILVQGDILEEDVRLSQRACGTVPSVLVDVVVDLTAKVLNDLEWARIATKLAIVVGIDSKQIVYRVIKLLQK